MGRPAVHVDAMPSLFAPDAHWSRISYRSQRKAMSLPRTVDEAACGVTGRCESSKDLKPGGRW